MLLNFWGRSLKGGINYTRYNNYSRDKSAMPGITGVINLSQIYSLHRAIPSFRNRSYSRYKVIPGIRHIYTWNRVIPKNNGLSFQMSNLCSLESLQIC